jgi:DNA-directed RNA polymerase subunit K/omega
MYAGKQEAARPTADACLKFLKKKYDIVGVVIEK